jgi:hypothetical protein
MFSAAKASDPEGRRYGVAELPLGKRPAVKSGTGADGGPLSVFTVAATTTL